MTSRFTPYRSQLNARTSRALLVAQFAVQRKQVPLIYAVVIIETLSIVYVLPAALPWVLRFGVSGLLIIISALRIVQWRALRTAKADAPAERPDEG